MARRVCTLLLMLLVLCVASPLELGVTHARHAIDSTLPTVCPDNTAPQVFHATSGITAVAVCPAVVEAGHSIRFTVLSRPFAPVHLELQYPNGDIAPKNGRTDQNGLATLSLVVRFNPLTRSTETPFAVTVGKPGGVDSVMVTGTVTIAQAPPLTNSRLCVRVDDSPSCCASVPASCSAHNGSTLTIRVDTDPGAQVNAAIYYPDGQSTPCSSNDITGTALAGPGGVFKCELPVSFQGKITRQGVNLLVVVQIDSSGATVSLQRRLWLVRN